MVSKRLYVLFGVVALVGCATMRSEQEPIPITPRSEVKVSPVVREALPPQPAPPPVEVAVPTPPSAPPAVIPPNTLYVCSKQVLGQIQQTAIEFVPKVELLCRRHPEMGPCQYERDICRRGGGRVFTADGTEITLFTEAEYDKKVMRVRFRAD